MCWSILVGWYYGSGQCHVPWENQARAKTLVYVYIHVYIEIFIYVFIYLYIYIYLFLLQQLRKQSLVLVVSFSILSSYSKS